MDQSQFLESWIPIVVGLREVEDHYRSQRLHPHGQAYPEGPDKERLYDALREACKLYISANGAQRDMMRALFAWSYVLPPYLLQLVSLRQDGLPESSLQTMRMALAAASLENNKTDYRDTYVALGELYLDALRAGLDPDPAFMEAASWSSSNDDFAYNMSPMREFLEGFKESMFFRTDVMPRVIELLARQLPHA